MAEMTDRINDYPQPDLRFGADVTADDGAHGIISELVPALPDADGEGGIRVTWDDGTITLISRRDVTVAEDGIRMHAAGRGRAIPGRAARG